MRYEGGTFQKRKASKENAPTTSEDAEDCEFQVKGDLVSQ